MSGIVAVVREMASTEGNGEEAEILGGGREPTEEATVRGGLKGHFPTSSTHLHEPQPPCCSPIRKMSKGGKARVGEAKSR